MERTPTATAPEMTIADDLLIGAEAIAVFLYGSAGTKELRDVYRNPFGFSFFKHGNAIAGLKSTIRAEVHEAQRAAAEKRRQMKKAEPRVVVKRRRRVRPIQQQVAAE
jgi:hypothetical protein